MSASTTHHGAAPHYFVPAPSAWPALAAAGLFVVILGASQWINGHAWGKYAVFAGLAWWAVILFRWFRDAVGESESGMYGRRIDISYRWSMAWFIFSEVMFFGAFFGALFYARSLSIPWLGGEGAKLSTNLALWPGFETEWPSNGPGNIGGDFETIPEWGIPFLNTVLLITSSFTVTWAHHALKEGKRQACILWMIATVALGSVFLYYQAHEYVEAYTELNLTLGSGIYGSTFFMLTGFHGMHVTLGTLMLIVITCRLAFGHFKPESHFGFEGVAWYWHFVDVVWIGLFTFVYVL
jgi:cytochrome c oxidase subunit 3